MLMALVHVQSNGRANYRDEAIEILLDGGMRLQHNETNLLGSSSMHERRGPSSNNPLFLIRIVVV